jgi:hypothetical protein
VLSNETICNDVFYPLVSIAPTSSRIDLKTYPDFPIKPTTSNGFHQPSLILLGHVQPIRKIDLRKKIGSLSLDEWERLLAHVLWSFDR